MQATYDTWQRAYSLEHFHKLSRGERRMQNNAAGRLWLRSLRLFKQLPNSPVTWLYLMILGSLAAFYGLLFDGWVRALLTLRDHMIEAVGEYSFGAFILWTMWNHLLFVLHLGIPHYQVLFERTNFTGFDMDEEIFAFVLLGIITGIGAGLYCKMALALRSVQVRLLERFHLTKPSIQRRSFHVVSICLATAIISFPFGIMRISDRVMVNELFRDQHFTVWGSSFVRRLWTVVTMGAAVGRYYGETLMEIWSPNQSPATYAFVGAACFAASATQTVSTAVIFFELTGQLSHMVPVMVACIAAYFVSGMISPSIYDILASWAGMNSVCYDFNKHALSQKTANDYMATVPIIFTRDTTYDEAIRALNTFKKEEYFPVCDNVENKLLLGCLRRFDLEVGIARFLAIHRNGKEDSKNAKVSEKIQDLISQVLDIDKKKSAAVDNVSLLNFQSKDTPTMSSMLELGPPFDKYEFTSIPVESYPPQVGEDVNLYRVHKLASISSWTQVYVVKFGKLQGVIHLDSSLTKLRKEDIPIRFS
ncbi:hypothetical protein PI125_g2789 [Phytophthora idaei]|nr:hypothetical protein PI125_g2789 [Phytophthora idaei]